MNKIKYYLKYLFSAAYEFNKTFDFSIIAIIHFFYIKDGIGTYYVKVKTIILFNIL